MIPNIRLSFATLRDVPEMFLVERESWGDRASDAETLAERIRIFPQSTPVVRDATGRMVAFGTALRISSYDLSGPSPSWSHVTGYGRFADVYDPKGKVLYGVNLSALRWLTAAGAAHSVVEALMGLVCDLRCHKIVLGGRMPMYSSLRRQFEADDYIRLRRYNGGVFFLDHDDRMVRYGGPAGSLPIKAERMTPRVWPAVDDHVAIRVMHQGKPLDPQIAFHLNCRCAGIGLEAVRAIPDYFDDPASCNYGVLYQWKNPFMDL